MLLIKRLLCMALDIVFFTVGILFIDFLFERLNTPPTPFLTIALSFFATFILPIISIGRPLSYALTNLNLAENNRNIGKLKLLLKYIGYYLFVSSELLSIISLFTGVLNQYTYIESETFFPIKIAGVLLLFNILCFSITLGRANLFDLLLKIQYDGTRFRKRPIDTLKLAYILSASILITTLIEFKINEHFSFQSVLDDFNGTSKDFFPIEVFGNYLETNLVSVRVQNTNRIITTSDISSFVYNQQLAQRQIVAYINDKVNGDQNQRKTLCYQLLNYCYTNPWTYRESLQTKFILVNIKRINPFVSLHTAYTYYYDDKTPFYRLYGGYNADSLSKFYERIQQEYHDLYITKVADALGLSKDTLLKYRTKDGSFEFPENLKINSVPTKIPLEYNFSLKGAAFAAVPFEKVEPLHTLRLNFPPGFVNYSLSNAELEALISTEAEETMFYLKSNYVFSR
jgi:hypothetical protein